MEPRERLSEQVVRILFTLQTMGRYRRPVTADSIHADVCREISDVCLRTTRRDLKILTRLGFVEYLENTARYRVVNHQLEIPRIMAKAKPESTLLKQTYGCPRCKSETPAQGTVVSYANTTGRPGKVTHCVKEFTCQLCSLVYCESVEI